MIPDMSVKAVYNSLVKSLKTLPTSQNTLEKSLGISNVHWPTIHMIPKKLRLSPVFESFSIKFSQYFIPEQ